MTWRDISVDRLDELRDPMLIDVRSPCEHKVESIPGAINVPLLSDEERAVVGTVYAREGEVSARRLALKIISPKIPEIVDQVVGLSKHGRSLVIHCWRGGLRSEAVASFLALIGIDCFRLTGGYKAWRQHVVSDLSADRYPFIAVVLHGQTGAGKTHILSALARQGAAVLDLEGLANHRGSVFGALGMPEQPSQKDFEAAIWSKLKKTRAEPLFLEAESRKIGRLALPDMLMKRIQSGRRVLVTCQVSARTQRIVSDYADSFDRSVAEAAVKSLQVLKERLGAKRLAAIEGLVLSGQLEQAVETMLLEYYDPLYDRQLSKFEPFELTVSGEDPEIAATKLLEWSLGLNLNVLVGSAHTDDQ